MTIRSPFRPAYGSTQTVTPAAGSAVITFGKGNKSVRVSNTDATNIGFFRCYNSANGTPAATAKDMPVEPGKVVIIEKAEDDDKLAHISAAGCTFVITAGEGGA